MKKALKEENISNKLISVIIPTYNSEKTIGRCLDSIYNQTVTNNIEIIIIDDHSTDNTMNIVKSFSNTNKIKLKLIENKVNRGAGFSRKIGIENANGYFISFLDSDDYWLKDKLVKQINFFESNSDLEFTYTDYLKEIDTKNKIYFFHMKMPKFVCHKKNKYINLIPNSSVIIKSKVLKDIDYPLIRTRNDFLFWNKILLRKNRINAYNSSYGRPLFVYGQYPGISKKNFNLIKNQWLLYRKYLNYSLLDSLLGLILNIFNSLINELKIKIYLVLKIKSLIK